MCILTLNVRLSLLIPVLRQLPVWVTLSVLCNAVMVRGHLECIQTQLQAVLMATLVTVTFLTSRKGLFLTNTWLVKALELFLLVPYITHPRVVLAVCIACYPTLVGNVVLLWLCRFELKILAVASLLLTVMVSPKFRKLLRLWQLLSDSGWATLVWVNNRCRRDPRQGSLLIRFNVSGRVVGPLPSVVSMEGMLVVSSGLKFTWFRVALILSSGLS